MTPVDQSYCPTLQHTYSIHRCSINGLDSVLPVRLSDQSVDLILLHGLSSYRLDQSGVIIHMIFKTTKI